MSKRPYLDDETYNALKAYCDKHGLKMYTFLRTAVEETIARRSIARRWDGQQFVNYEVSYPEEPATDE